MEKLNRIWFALFILIALFLSGCSFPPTVTVPVKMPSVVNMKGLKRVSIVQIKGNVGPRLENLLASRLFNAGFTIVDRNALKAILKEHQLDMSGIIDQSTATKLGKITAVDCLIYGTANMNYQVRRWEGSKWTDQDGNSHQDYKICGKAVVHTTLKVVGVHTGKILAIKTITATAQDLQTKTDQWPQEPDEDSIETSALNDAVNRFTKMLVPYTVYYTVEFEESKIPESKVAIKLAQQGLWKEALKEFKKAKDKAPAKTSSWYNLGLAYEYNFMFRQAKNAFHEAFKIKPDPKYIKAINQVDSLKRQEEKLKAETAY